MRPDQTTRPYNHRGHDRTCTVAADDVALSRTNLLTTSLLEPPNPDVSDEEHQQRLLMTLDMVVASFESLIDALAADERSTKRTLAYLDEAYKASAKYRAA